MAPSVADNWDFIIVGAGSAGCVLANRLSADPATRVLLIEAGGNDNVMMIQMPAGIAQLISPEKPSPYNWGFWTVPQPEMGDRAMFWPRGRAIGGSSSINGMVYIRGHASDYDRWAQLGLTGWGWADVLPYFRKSEDSDRGSDDFHGAGGPLHTSRKGALPHVLNEAFITAAVEAGYERTDDFNGPQFEGAGMYDATIKNGSRFSAAKAYLTAQVRARPNLEIRTGVQVERVVIEGKRATGIAYTRRRAAGGLRHRHRLYARRCVRNRPRPGDHPVRRRGQFAAAADAVGDRARRASQGDEHPGHP